MHSDLIRLILSYLPEQKIATIDYDNQQFWQFLLDRDFNDKNFQFDYQRRYKGFVLKTIKIIDIIYLLFDYIKSKYNSIKNNTNFNLYLFIKNFIAFYIGDNLDIIYLPGNREKFIISLNNKNISYFADVTGWMPFLVHEILELAKTINMDKLYINNIKHTVSNTYKINLISS